MNIIKMGMKIHEKIHSNLKYWNNLNQCSDTTITEQIKITLKYCVLVGEHGAGVQ